MKYVLFVCTHNAGRSQMARAWLERAPDLLQRSPPSALARTPLRADAEFSFPLPSPDGAGPLAKRDCTAYQPVFKYARVAARRIKKPAGVADDLAVGRLLTRAHPAGHCRPALKYDAAPAA
jgi:hypothetical protein